MNIFKISDLESDQTIISFLRKKFKSSPLSLIYKLFRKKKILINDEIIRYYHYRLKTGEYVKIFDKFLKKTSPTISSFYPISRNKIYFRILYEDDKIMFVEKEYGINCSSLNNSVRSYIFHKDENIYREMIRKSFSISSSHRLDKLVRGLLIYTKKSSIKNEVNKSISDKEKIKKKYFALVENFFYNWEIKLMEGFIYKNDKLQRMFFTDDKGSFNISNFKSCSLKIKKMKKMESGILNLFPSYLSSISKENFSLLEITLYTGRKHQIRATLSFLRIPIFGDFKYGSSFDSRFGICLIAYSLSFNKMQGALSYLNGRNYSLI